MILKELRRQISGLSDETQLVLLIEGTYHKIGNVNVGKTIEGDVLSEQIPECTNKKVIIFE